MTAIPDTVEELIDVIEGLQDSSTIDELSGLSSLAYDDKIPIWDSSTGLTKAASIGSFSLAIDQVLSSDPPGPVTNASVTTTGITGHKLTWTNPNDLDLGFVFIYRVAVISGASAPVFGDTTLYDPVSIPRDKVSYSMTRTVGGVNPSKDYYYWLVAVDKSGNTSSEVFAGVVLAGNNPSIEYIMDELTGNIRYSDLEQQLTDQYDLLDSSYVLGVNANGHVSGMVFVNDGTSSVCTFVVDKFAIVQSDGLNTIVPFVVGTVGGVSTVGISGQLVVDGTIKTYSLDVDDVFVGNNIESSDYSGGATGWKLFGDGTAIFRGGSISLVKADITDFPDTIKTFAQDSTPTAESVGDIWYDTDDGNHMYVWDGFAWNSVQDADIAQAISNAATAQATADGKIYTFYSDDAPTAESVGDLWVDTDDGNKLHRWSGSAWVDVQDADIAQALSDAAGAQATADGKIFTFYSSSAPTADGIGDLWVDTDDGNKLYRWSGSAWIGIQDNGITQALSDAAGAQATADGKIVSFYSINAPTADGVGDLWIDTNDGNKLYRWSGSAWVVVQDNGITQAISDAADAQSTADSKIVSFFSASAPTAEGVGDLWYDTDDGDKPYRWNGSAWVEIDLDWSNVTNKGRFADTPSGTGVKFTDDYIGFYDSGDWKVYIQNDAGTGKFYCGDGANLFMDYDGINLNLSFNSNGSLTLESGGTIDCKAGADINMIGTTGNSSKINFYSSTTNLVASIYSDYTSTGLYITHDSGPKIYITDSMVALSVPSTIFDITSGNVEIINGDFSVDGDITGDSLDVGTGSIDCGILDVASDITCDDITLTGDITKSGSLDVGSSSGSLILKGSGGLVQLYNSSAKSMYLTGSAWRPGTDNDITNGTSSCEFSASYANAFYEGGGGYNHAGRAGKTDIEILAQMQPLDEVDELGIRKVDVLSCADHWTNREYLKKEISRETNRRVADVDLDIMLSSDPKIKKRLKLNRGRQIDDLIGAVLDLHSRIQKIEEIV